MSITLSAQNIRSIGDTGTLEIRPITIFVGANSTGKSTITRFFPLLRQSVENRTNAPLLWYADLVDFGSYSAVKSSHNDDGAISFELTSDLDSFLKDIPFDNPRDKAAFESFKKIGFKVELDERQGRTSVKSTTITLGTDKIDIFFTDGSPVSIKVNGYNHSAMIKDESISGITDSTLFPINLTATAYAVPYFNLFGSRSQSYRYFLPGYENMVSFLEMRRALAAIAHGGTSNHRYRHIIGNLRIMPAQKFYQHLATLADAPPKFRANVSDAIQQGKFEKLEAIRRNLLITRFGQISSILEAGFTELFRSITYIGPSRATGERYYRMQELAVREIDPRGENLAMYLSSLSDDDAEELSSQFSKIFGYEVSTKRYESSHVSIHLREEGSKHFVNLADVGYGFSQLLPIFAQLFIEGKRNQGTTGRVITIEQPELHLHPKFQSKLVDAFSGTIYYEEEGERKLTNVRIVSETHSPAIINTLGRKVKSGEISSDDVAVYIFEREDGNSCTSVRMATYDNSGALLGWPYGFFSER